MATAAFENPDPLKRDDVICPICWSVLIEPVTLPCKHNLCLECIRKHLNETALACPCCRKRLSVWSRKACKENNLVNVTYWERIKREFPRLVHARLNNQDSQDLCLEDTISTEEACFAANKTVEEEEDLALAYRPTKRDGEVANQGEIRQEFEHMYSVHREDLENQRLREAEASSEYIRKLQEEERRLEAEGLTEREADLEYAKRLQMEEDARVKAIAASKMTSTIKKEPVNKKKLCRNLLSEWGPSLTTPKANSSIAKKSGSQFSNTPRTPSSNNLKRRSSHSNSCGSSKSNKIGRKTDKDVNTSQSSILNFFSNSQSQELNSSKSESPKPSTSAAAVAEMKANSQTSSFVTVRGNSSNNTANIVSPIKTETPKNSTHKSDTRSDAHPPAVTFADPPKIGGGKGTPDSIHVELNSHFRPIRSAPKTPPKRLADGTYLPEPKIVKTTPIRPSPKLAAVVTAPAHNLVFEDKINEVELSPSKDSQASVSSNGDTEIHLYRGLKEACGDSTDSSASTNQDSIIKIEVEDADELSSTITISSQDSNVSDVIPTTCAKWDAIINTTNSLLPSNQYEIEEEAKKLELFRKKKEQELEDYKLALSLQKELNQTPTIERARFSKEQYSLRNWLKPKDGVSKTTPAKAKPNSSRTKDKQPEKLIAISHAKRAIKKEKEETVTGNDISHPLSNIVNSHKVINTLSPYDAEGI